MGQPSGRAYLARIANAFVTDLRSDTVGAAVRTDFKSNASPTQSHHGAVYAPGSNTYNAHFGGSRGELYGAVHNNVQISKRVYEPTI